ncbi:MAG: hypothetical protein A3D57_01865 [Candidatus Sungbacteria bacterium RIFCSPHIGHO2_02_FULL_46_12]|nr:MAG: hypothetical protein A3D57_01865 [Candidatus Sungbacteria bacterium RIFCSPHIGHO2_02_FULL_46_12]
MKCKRVLLHFRASEDNKGFNTLYLKNYSYKKSRPIFLHSMRSHMWGKTGLLVTRPSACQPVV